MATVGKVRLKPGVRLDGLQSAGIRILAAIDNAARVLGVDLTVTCGTEGHAADDPHTKGNALDVRTTDLTILTTLKVHQLAKELLGPDFTVLYESNLKPADPDLQRIVYLNAAASGPHFHLQLKKGLTDFGALEGPLHV